MSSKDLSGVLKFCYLTFMPQEEQGFYEFEQFHLDPSRRLLLRQGEPVPLPPKALATLMALLERRGEVVGKDELLQLVWPDTFISEATLTQNIFRLRKALGEEAGEHRFIVTVPGRGYSFVAVAAWKVAVEKPMPEEPAPARPASRPQMPIPPVAIPPPEPPEQPARRPRHRALIAVGVALLLLAPGLFVASWLLNRRAVRERPPQSSSLRRTVAVWGFRNLSGRPDSAWLSTALAELFTGELAMGEKLHVLSGETVARTRMDLGLGQAEDLTPESLAKIRGILGCDTVLLGSYLKLPSQSGHTVRVDLRLIDTATGETLDAATRSSSESDLFGMIAGLGTYMRRRLGAEAPAGRPAARASFPSDPEAARLYSEGLSALRALDDQKARDLLSRAVQEEPAFPLAHAALARTWLNLGYDANAEREATEASRHSAALPREERLLIDGLRAETAKDWPRAIEIYSTLWAFFPDDLEHGLRLARAQTEAGKSREAINTIAALRRLPQPLAEDPRLDLAEGGARLALADYAGQQRLAAEAIAKGRSLGARLLLAQALHLQGRALRSLGRHPEALASIGDAARLFAEAGDRAGVAATANDSANLMMDQGNLDGARREYERALAINREIGNQRGKMLALRNMGGIDAEQGSYARAKELLSEALAIAREIHDRPGQAGVLINLGYVLRTEGDLQAAEKSFEECLSLYRDLRYPAGEATARANLADVLLDQGDLQNARSQADAALRLFEGATHPRGISFTLGRIGSLLLDEGRLPEARQTYNRMLAVSRGAAQASLGAEAESGLAAVSRLTGNLAEARQHEQTALALRRGFRERLSIGKSRLSLAELSLDQGNPASAEREAREVADLFRTLGARDWEGLARKTLALALLAQGKGPAAEQAVHDALQLTDWSRNRRFWLQVRIASGRTAAAAGRLAEARQTLEAARNEAISRGLWIQRLEAELALGEIEFRHGDAIAGRRMLQALQQQAERKGFVQIARQAGDLFTNRR